MKNNKLTGLSLVELMVVVAIISIISAIAIPKFEVHFQKARLTEAVKMIRHIKGALEVYRSESDGKLVLTEPDGETPIVQIIGNSAINAHGLYIKIPDNAYFEYFISAYPYAGIDASTENFRIGARHPYGTASNSIDSLTLITNEFGYESKVKLRGSTEFLAN